MLGKLFKYDFLAVGKKLLPVYAALFISVMGLNINVYIYRGSDFGVLGGIFAMLFTLSTMAVAIGTVVMLIRHFYVSLFTDQGYFTFTLPVGEGTQLAAKLLNGAAYSAISAIVIFFATIFTATNSLNFNTLGEIFRNVGQFFDALNSVGISYGYMWFVIIAYILGGLFFGQIMVYFCIILGQMWGKHRVLGAILIGVGLYILNMIIFSSFAISNVAPLMELNECAEAINSGIHFVTSMINYSIIVSTIQALVALVLSWFILKRHTNIE